MKKTRDEVLEQLQAILAKADPARNASQSEAEVAMAMAERLMAKYNISMAEVEGHEPEDARFVAEYYTVITSGNWARMHYYWRWQLVTMIAEANGCKALIDRDSPKIIVVGRKALIPGIMYLYSYLEATIIRLANEAVQQSKRKTAGDKNDYLKNWIRGFIGSVGRRLREAKQEAEANYDSSTTALVRRGDEALMAYYHQQFPYTSKISQGGGYDSEAYGSGNRAGDSVALNKGLTVNGRNLLT